MEQRKLSDETGPLDEKQEKENRRRRSKKKSMPWYLKGGITLVLIFLSLLVGLMIGYSGIGHGPLREVFEISTYKHMYDLVFKLT
jgi:hypothetical protein